MADLGIKLAAGLYGLSLGPARRASRPVEGDAARMGRAEALWWAYKFYWGPIEEPEPGSGLEEEFRSQDLDFSPAALERRLGGGFAEKASATLAAAGDILVSPDITPETTEALFDDVAPFLFGADLAFANLETPVAASAPPGFLPKSVASPLALNSSPAMLDRVIGGPGGFALFSTANNHCLDQGEAGLRETLDALDARGVLHAGTARSAAERDAPVLVERNGLKVAFLSFTFGLNRERLPEGRDYLANVVRLNLPEPDLTPLAREAAAARAAGADAVVACLHWSLEFESYPTRRLVTTARRVVELGVDLVVGNHPHGVQPILRHDWLDPASGERREGLVLFALGDLVTVRDGVLPNSHLGLLARVRLSKGRAEGREATRITGLELLPTYLFPRMRGRTCEEFRLLDLRTLAAELRAGGNRFGLSRRQARDLPRLEALMRRLFGPGLGGA